jgi:hypothetical protein
MYAAKISVKRKKKEQRKVETFAQTNHQYLLKGTEKKN